MSYSSRLLWLTHIRLRYISARPESDWGNKRRQADSLQLKYLSSSLLRPPSGSDLTWTDLSCMNRDHWFPRKTRSFEKKTNEMGTIRSFAAMRLKIRWVCAVRMRQTPVGYWKLGNQTRGPVQLAISRSSLRTATICELCVMYFIGCSPTLSVHCHNSIVKSKYLST